MTQAEATLERVIAGKIPQLSERLWPRPLRAVPVDVRAIPGFVSLAQNWGADTTTFQFRDRSTLTKTSQGWGARDGA